MSGSPASSTTVPLTCMPCAIPLREKTKSISNEGTEDVNLRITVPDLGDDETKGRAQVIMRTCELGLIGIARDYNDSKNRYVEIIHSKTPEV